MTFEEAQQIIQQILVSQARFEERLQSHEQMFEREMGKILAVQRDLQEGELRLQQRQAQYEAASQERQLRSEAASQEYRDRFERDMARMSAVQQDLQEGQLRQMSAIQNLLISSERHERMVNQLIGYSITNQSDHLDLEERMRALGAKMQRIEQQNQ
jgi:hypothetical protein